MQLGAADRATSLRIAYLVSMYPAVSHTFILREVLALRQLSIELEVASINDPSAYMLTAEERGEEQRTFYVKRQGAAGAGATAARMLLRHPARLVRGLRRALQLSGPGLKRRSLHVFYWLEALILLDWMRRRRLTHLHVHFATPASTVALILASMAPITFSMTVHGPDEFYDVPGYRLAEKIEAALFVVCISFFARSQLMKISGQALWSKLEVARLGVDASHFAPPPPRAQPEPLEILCVGRMVPAKGQRILLEAVARLVEEGRSVRLRLIGDGPDRAALEQFAATRGIARHTSFEGAVNQERIRAFYAGADVFALPSFAEGIPVVLMEAMAMEIPCVSTRIHGIPELIRDGVDGLLVAPSDVDGLCQAFRTLMDEPCLRQSLGRAGRARVQAEYDLPRSVDRLAAIFHHRLGVAQ
jgi:glycosyltransferase involved in cell wall biosynthesis